MPPTASETAPANAMKIPYLMLKPVPQMSPGRSNQRSTTSKAL
jgi:hypothetical protein